MKKNQKNKPAFISIFAIFFSAIVISVLTALYVLLVKQIEIMNLDATSFQAAYMADSAFECALYKIQNATGTKSVFQPANSGNLGSCAVAGDANWQTSPDGKPKVTSGRSNSVLNVSMASTSLGDFCGIVTTGEENSNQQISNFMSISGEDRNCNDAITASTKVVERVIEFYY